MNVHNSIVSTAIHVQTHTHILLWTAVAVFLLVVQQPLQGRLPHVLLPAVHVVLPAVLAPLLVVLGFQMQPGLLATM